MKNESGFIKEELTVSSRSIRMALILLIFNSVLAIVALFNMFTGGRAG